jgi:molybdate transport system ATP-binding protein
MWGSQRLPLDRMAKGEILPHFEALHASLSIPVHDISEIERLADHMVLLDSGRVVAAGPLNELLADTRLPIANSPQASTVLEARVGSYSPEDGLTALDIGGGNCWCRGGWPIMEGQSASESAPRTSAYPWIARRR